MGLLGLSGTWPSASGSRTSQRVWRSASPARGWLLHLEGLLVSAPERPVPGPVPGRGHGAAELRTVPWAASLCQATPLTWKRIRRFWYGQLSGMVEPLAGLFGAFAVVLAEPLLPYALAFAAGAMVYVVMDDIIPEAQIR
ncbi:hypothetical protein QTO34_008828 [Cnephaeus nilssonii]|uniref:Uncharacterized protein n=1 Tax=Cnephaeus nilssonii TaxID=3371016 RepID=A0AA40LEV9_CNENI|nr:hypothetical protein QTO34_008828 [Eptesicus nilssonii]